MRPLIPVDSCPCGEVHHVDPATWEAWQKTAEGKPALERVECQAGAWLVSRIWLALHPVRARSLPYLAQYLGWQPAPA